MASLPMSRFSWRAAVMLLGWCGALAAGGLVQAQTYGIGRPLSEAEVAPWNIDVDMHGKGLPAGSGSVARGREVYAQYCAACHGDHGQGNPADALAGGQGSLATAKPLKTIGSYWPYASTVFDFINRAMPYNAPKSLTADQVYAVTAYLLYLNHIVSDDTVLDAASLATVQMPNRNGFIGDTRPDTDNVACRQHCPSGTAHSAH